jgi:hypothetical protein
MGRCHAVKLFGLRDDEDDDGDRYLTFFKYDTEPFTMLSDPSNGAAHAGGSIYLGRTHPVHEI